MNAAFSSDLLLLGALAGLTLLAYMIAINARGMARLSISYLLATLMLAGSVFAIVQYVNSGQDQKKQEILKKLELEKQQAEMDKQTAEMDKQKAEEQVKTQVQVMQTTKERAAFAALLNGICSRGTNLAAMLNNVDLRDMSLELDVLMGKATDAANRAASLRRELNRIKSVDSAFIAPMNVVRDGLGLLQESCELYMQYYHAEDPGQEEARERAMREKARGASDKFQRAGTLIANVL
jgi:hypothetical protein